MSNYDIACKVSNLILDAKERLGTYKAVALELGIDERSVRRWRDGYCLPTLPTYFAIKELVNQSDNDELSD